MTGEVEEVAPIRVRVVGKADRPQTSEDRARARTTKSGRRMQAASRSRLEKQRVGGQALAPSDAQQFGVSDTIEPPYDLELLAGMLEHSNALRQNIDAYAVNIDAFGHRFDPVIDITSDEADRIIRSLLFIERQRLAPDPQVPDPTAQAPEPSDDEVEARKAELIEQMRIERARVERFFENASLEMSFTKLRRLMRQDKELVGNGYWEVLRHPQTNELQGFDRVIGSTVRLTPLSSCRVMTFSYLKTGDFGFEKVEVQKRMRLFVQEHEGTRVYFKQPHDPRIISAKTGREYPSVEALKENDPTDGPATELVHFPVEATNSAYGIPRWIGLLPSVLGSRLADEVNLSYFNNKSVPPLVISVSGGRLTDECVQRLEDHVNKEIRGKSNFHKMLIIEADTTSTQSMEHTGRMRIDIKPLTQAQHNDGLFLKYDERNADKVGQAFRLSRMLRGDVRDFNRATAKAALDFAEKQVFQPERDDFDFFINRFVLPEIGIRYWTFRSNSPTTQDPVELSKMLAELTQAGVLTPAEARQIAGGIFNRQLPHITAPWVRQPIQLTLAGVAPPEDLAAPGMVGADGLPKPSEVPAEAPMAQTTDGGFELTSSDMVTIATVNEARNAVGLGPLLLVDGSQDPDGLLTVAEFKAKRAKAGEAVGQAEGQQAAAGGPARLLPGGQTQEQVLARAQELLSLRKALTELARDESQAELEAERESDG